MILSVQISNLKYSVDISPDLLQFEVREKVYGVFLARMNIAIQIWHIVEVMQRYFKKHHMTQVPITENQLRTMQMMEEVSEHVRMIYTDTPDSRYVAQPVNDFLIPRKEMGSAENPIAIDEDEEFSAIMHRNSPPQHSPCSEFYRELPEISTTLWLIIF